MSDYEESSAEHSHQEHVLWAAENDGHELSSPGRVPVNVPFPLGRTQPAGAARKPTMDRHRGGSPYLHVLTTGEMFYTAKTDRRSHCITHHPQLSYLGKYACINTDFEWVRNLGMA